jgi:hypothetical protein
MTKRDVLIQETKNKSLITPISQTLIMKDKDRREFFRYEDGEVIEYDLTKANGKLIILKREEEEGLREFEPQK